MLYDRDFRILTKEEQELWKKAEAILIQKSRIISTAVYRKYYELLPVAALHHNQLFPNNFLNEDDLSEIVKLKKIKKEFKSLLDNQSTERKILNFIREKKAYFIIASILKS